MNPAVRKTTAIVGLAVLGAFAADRMTRSKNDPVIWGINSQLDQMNGDADMGKDNSFVLAFRNWDRV
jgi:hypothetical protein